MLHEIYLQSYVQFKNLFRMFCFEKINREVAAISLDTRINEI